MQAAEIAAPDAIGATNLENLKFSDYFLGYIPEITEAFDRSQSGWLGTWTARNELGRPVHHTFGLSPAYPPSMLLAAIADSPHRFITVLSLGTCLAAGLFILLLCRELGLSPLAGLLAGSSLAASPFFMYWLTFPMFTAAYCWAAGALYAVTRIDRKPDLLGWGVLAFCMQPADDGYQQLVVFHAYLLAGYGALWPTHVGGPALEVPADALGIDVRRFSSKRAHRADVRTSPSSLKSAGPPVHPSTANWRSSVLNDIVTFVVLGIPKSGQPGFARLSARLWRTQRYTAGNLSGVGALLLRPRETWGWWLAIVVLTCCSSSSRSTSLA
jgi:hypothetical protein